MSLDLESVAMTLVPDGKGILAADEDRSHIDESGLIRSASPRPRVTRVPGVPETPLPKTPLSGNTSFRKPLLMPLPRSPAPLAG